MITTAVVFYVIGAAVVGLLVTKLRRTRRGSGGPVHDRYEAAFLNGGPARVVDSALAALQAEGRLVIGGPGLVWAAQQGATAQDPVERAVLAEHTAAGNGALAPLRIEVMRHPAVQEIGDALAARGLLVEPRARRSAIRWSIGTGIASVCMLPVTLVVTVMEMTGPGSSVPFILRVLPALFGVIVTAVVCGSSVASRTTPAGRAAVTAFGRGHAHLADPGTLVALHGLRALPDPALREQLATAARTPVHRPRPHASHRVRSSSGSDSSHDAAVLPVMWCASAAGGETGGGGCGSGNSCSGGGSSCSGGGSSCSGGGSSCSSSSCSSSSSSCSSSSSSCSSSSSSCSSSS
ncbi:TIGR04222 domain-containing membrane protein [Streptomyces sp. NPDC048018]|uniref:TIGR04222 domain-containing membrane protein n=1 Tax=Streptomyces sp. NPDC048018 TaxID=3365499 RepID=UPI00370FA1EF